MTGSSQSGLANFARAHRDRIIRFLGAGVVNTLFGYAVFSALVLIGAHPQVALAVQFVVGVMWNYRVHGRFVFAVSGYDRLPQYAVSYVVIYVFNAILLAALLRLGLSAYVAQALALAPTVVLSYVLISHVLRSRPDGLAR